MRLHSTSRGKIGLEWAEEVPPLYKERETKITVFVSIIVFVDINATIGIVKYDI